jgi:hypothetical protein
MTKRLDALKASWKALGLLEWDYELVSRISKCGRKQQKRGKQAPRKVAFPRIFAHAKLGAVKCGNLRWGTPCIRLEAEMRASFVEEAQASHCDHNLQPQLRTRPQPRQLPHEY